MVGGHRRLCRYLAHSVVLFLGLSLHDVEASMNKRVIKKVGDTVQLSPNLPTEGLIFAEWKYEGKKVADGDAGVVNNTFGTRLEFNQMNFSLTLKNLIPGDSGDFNFVSAIKEGQQRQTLIITLLVQEIITQQPVLTVTVGPPISNGSCTVLVNCSAAPGSSVTYSITVGNQSHGGPSLQHTIRPQDGDTTATCTVSNDVSEKSASTKVTCENTDPDKQKVNLLLIVSASGGCLLIFIVIGVAVCICRCKHKSSGSDSNELTVYADISNVALESGNQEPCSLYDTIQEASGADIWGSEIPPKTVYDQIQLSRIRAPSVSPYQEIP